MSVFFTVMQHVLLSLFIPEKYAQVQQNPVLPPASFFLRCKNSKEVSFSPFTCCTSIQTWMLQICVAVCLSRAAFTCCVFCRDRLSASDMLQVRKVMEHVYEKIINLDNESQTTSSSANDKPGEQEKEEDMAMLAEEKIELMCQDQVAIFACTVFFFLRPQSLFTLLTFVLFFCL